MQRLFQLAFCKCFHHGGSLLVQRAAPKILRDRVEPLRIDFLDGMVGGKRRQTVEIIFNLVDEVEIPVLAEPMIAESTLGRRKTA